MAHVQPSDDDDVVMGTAYGMPPEQDLHEEAASCGIVAAAEAVRVGQSQGLSRDEIARDAHQAAELAYQAYLAAAHHAEVDDEAAAAEGHVGATAIEGRVGRHGVGAYVVRRPPMRHEPTGPIVVRRPPMVGAPMSVGHGGGHGGGGHGGHGHGHHHDTLLLGGWAPDYYWDAPVVLACGPGQLLLADGTCFDPAHHGYAVGGVQVGAPAPAGPQAVTCYVDDDGTIELPDGSTVHVDAIDFGDIATVGQGTEHGRHMRVGDSQTFDPYTGGSDNLGGAAGATGTNANVTAQLAALNLQWQALAQVIPANASLPTAYEPNFTSTTFQSDYSGWTQFYNDTATGSTSSATIFGDITGWQASANGWGSWWRATNPNAQLPANFPMGSAGIASITPSSDTLSSIGSAIQWAVVAVAIGLGVWLLWPVLVAGKGAAAAAL